MRTTLLALALGLAASTAAHAEPAPALDLTISGPIDPALLATSIASELRRPIAPHTAAEGCHAPCLAIAVDRDTATLTYTAAGGATRQRTLALPADASAWPTLVTLLAGNLVRDEADELLADAPPAPPPGSAPAASLAPAALAPVAPPALISSPAALPVISAVPSPSAPTLHGELEPRFSPFAISLVPGASTDLLDLQRSHVVSIGLVAEASSRVRGLAVSGAADVAGEVDGLQLAGAVGVAHVVDGGQISGAVAVAGETSGVQVAGAVTVSGHARGTQIAGGVAVARASAGTQIAGGVAIAKQFAGTQIAGGVTVTGRLAGLQIAPINIARRNDGVQIGVLNIGGGLDGRAFGLINIVPGGRTDVEAAIDSDATGTVLLRHGSRRWHNVYGVGGQHVDAASGMPNDDLWMLGLGFGPSFRLAGLPADLEAIAWHVDHGSAFDEHLSLLAQLRLTISVPIGAAALVAGGAINTYISNDPTSPLAIARTSGDPMTSDVHVHIWPSAFIGVRL